MFECLFKYEETGNLQFSYLCSYTFVCSVQQIYPDKLVQIGTPCVYTAVQTTATCLSPYKMARLLYYEHVILKHLYSLVAIGRFPGENFNLD